MRKVSIMVTMIFFFGVISYANLGLACPVCHSDIGFAVRFNIIQRSPLIILLSLMVAFSLFIALSYGMSSVLTRSGLKKTTLSFKNPIKSVVMRLTFTGMLIGGSLAGFMDGIIFHQLLQTHSLIANWLPTNSLINLEVNMFWDGVFHLFTFILLLVGLIKLWRLAEYKKALGFYRLRGPLLFGMGLFNCIEGLLDHQLIQFHHVLQNASSSLQWYADVTFLIVSVLLMGIGLYYCLTRHRIAQLTPA